MSQKEYTEDIVFWSLKQAEQFSARRRTIQLFLANNATEYVYTWIDNTPTVWRELLDVLEENDPARIAVNVDREIAFGGGLHVGELRNIVDELGEEWSKRCELISYEKFFLIGGGLLAEIFFCFVFWWKIELLE